MLGCRQNYFFVYRQKCASSLCRNRVERSEISDTSDQKLVLRDIMNLFVIQINSSARLVIFVVTVPSPLLCLHVLSLYFLIHSRLLCSLSTRTALSILFVLYAFALSHNYDLPFTSTIALPLLPSCYTPHYSGGSFNPEAAF